jgi:hypothetical protein
MSETSEAARQLSRRRWRQPEIVEHRVDLLAEHIRRAVGKLPPLTDAQQARLRASLPGGELR